MVFANYSDFRTSVLKMIDGDDSGAGSIAQSTLDLLIALGESRVYHGDESTPGLRCADMETSLSLPVTANAVTLPANCLELIRVQFSGEKPLDYMTEDTLLRMLDNSAGGSPVRHYTRQGRTLTFYPEAAGTLGGRYYARPADIAAGLHATFNRYPECFLFGALAEAAPFIGEDSRLPMWKQLFAGWLASARRTERIQASSGSRLTVKAR